MISLLFREFLSSTNERIYVSADIRPVTIAEALPFRIGASVEGFHSENGEDARGKPTETRVAGFVACNIAFIAFSHDTDGIFTLC